MAAADTAEGHPRAPQGAVFFDGLHGVLGTGRGKAAAGLAVGRDAAPVKADEGQKQRFHSVPSRKRPSFPQAVR